MENNESALFAQLLEQAEHLGASGAKLIPAALICVEDKVLDMCQKPFCNGYGKSANCPPHTMKPWEFREVLKSYAHALIFKIDVPQQVMLSDDRHDAFRKIYEIAAKLEARAKDAGLVKSRGYAAGSCKPVFCRDHKACQALKDRQRCRMPDLARPSMEAVGINVMKLVTDAGWEIQQIDKQTQIGTVPNVVLSGLVILG
jgi:predicted metal-binding protein